MCLLVCKFFLKNFEKKYLLLILRKCVILQHFFKLNIMDALKKNSKK